jgi:hypothetical protein
MSLKKSLWAALAAFVVIGLLFTGCPTESGGSSAEVDYTKTELWKEVVKAETLLSQTEVTIYSAAAAGTDIPEGVEYVTDTQQAAFGQAIGKAKALAQTGISGADEEDAIKDLLSAKTIFTTAKTTNAATAGTPGGNAKKAEVGTLVTVLAGGGSPLSAATVVITASGDLSAALTLVGGNTVIIPSGVTVSTGGQDVTLGASSSIAGNILVKNGGTFMATAAGTKSGATGGASTITVESGGTYIDETTTGDAFVPANSTVTITVKAGGVLKQVLPGSSSPVVLIGPSAGNNTCKIVLGSGATITRVTADYTLTGTATLAADLLLPPKLTIAASSELIVAAGKTLIVNGTAISASPVVVPAVVVAGTDDTSRVKLGTGSRIVVIGGEETAGVTGDTGFLTDAAIWKLESGIVVPPYHITPYIVPATPKGLVTTGPNEFKITSSKWVVVE